MLDLAGCQTTMVLECDQKEEKQKLGNLNSLYTVLDFEQAIKCHPNVLFASFRLLVLSVVVPSWQFLKMWYRVKTLHIHLVCRHHSWNIKHHAQERALLSD